MREETGLDVAIDRFVTVLDRISRDASGAVQYHFVLADYRCRVVGGTLRAGDDADEVTWVEIDELPRYGVAAGHDRGDQDGMRSRRRRVVRTITPSLTFPRRHDVGRMQNAGVGVQRPHECRSRLREQVPGRGSK